MAHRISVNPEWPVTALFKQVDDRPDVVKQFHEALLHYLQKKYSRSIAILENLALSIQEWPIFYNSSLGYTQLGYFDVAHQYLRRAQELGLPERFVDAEIDLLWLMRRTDEAIQRVQRLRSPLLQGMYRELLGQSVSSPEEIKELRGNFLKSIRPSLRIAYFMTATNLCGGAKIILEHVHQLSSKGHDVSIISFDSVPDWYSVKVPFYQTDFRLSNLMDMPHFDIAVSGFFWLNLLCLRLADRTYHFAQGDEWTFGYDLKVDPIMKDIVYQFHALPNKQLVVSTFLAQAIAKNFDRSDSTLIANAVEDFFVPSDRSDPFQIIMVGSEMNAFKNVPVMMQALDIVRLRGYPIKVIWVSSTPRQNQSFVCDFYERPDRYLLADLYRSSGVFISASDFEASPLVFIEAMKSRLAIVTSDSGGVRDYIRDGENAIVVQKIVADHFADAIERLLSNDVLRETLSNNAWEASRRFNWRRSMEVLEDTFYDDLAINFPVIP